MVLPEARAELREALSALIGGQLSNDGFDEVYYRLCARSPDRAIEEIGEFGWGLYSSDLLWSYTLTGSHAVSDETRAIAERCDLFLQSGFEYEWPSFPQLGWMQFVWTIAVTPGVLSLFAGALIPLALYNHAWDEAGLFAHIAVLAALPGVWAYRWSKRYENRHLAEFWKCGSRNGWPFLTDESLQEMSRTIDDTSEETTT